MQWLVTFYLYWRSVALLKYWVFSSSNGSDAQENPLILWSFVWVVHQQAQCEQTLVMFQHELSLLSRTFLDSLMKESQKFILLRHVQAAELWNQVSSVRAEHFSLPY